MPVKKSKIKLSTQKKRGAPKKANKKVMSIFTLDPDVKKMLDKKITSGNRSKFVNQVIAEKLGLVGKSDTTFFGSIFKK